MTATDLESTAIEPTVFLASRDTYLNQHLRRLDTTQVCKMSQNMAYTPIIQNAIPVRYDARVEVKPCEPTHVPCLPLHILYHIAKALPQPKQVFNLALASKDTWEHLQPAFYECEVTYEARLTRKYGDESTTSLRQYYGDYLPKEVTASGTDQSREGNDLKCQGHGISGECGEGVERLDLEDRVFDLELAMPEERFKIDEAMTALHWAAMQGTSALPVAQKAIRSALAHQPSYINGLNLKVRYYRDGDAVDGHPRLFPVDLPPPLFLAVAHGNTAVVGALIDAGCDLDLLQGQELCTPYDCPRRKETRLMSYMIHRECEEAEEIPEKCVCEWLPGEYLTEANPCQTVGHLAIELGKTEMLEMLLQGGLNARQGLFPLIHYAVMKGNVAAVKALLDYDPSLLHSRMEHGTVLHTVTFMKQDDDKEDVRDGRLRDMVSCLLEYGADLEARTNVFTNVFGQERGRLTPLQATLNFVDRQELDDQVFVALHAAEVLISMGAGWDQELHSTMFDGSILDFCVRKTVRLLNVQYFNLGYDDDGSEFLYRKIRQAFGRIVKTIVEKATEGLSPDDSAVKMETCKAAFSQAFSCLTRHQARSQIGPFAAHAVGRLLLSTGITPNAKDMCRWKALLHQGDDERSDASDRSDRSDRSDGSDDGLSDASEDEAWFVSYGEVSDESDDEASVSSDEEPSKTGALRRRLVEDGSARKWAFLLSGLDDEGWVSDIGEGELGDTDDGTDDSIVGDSDDESMTSEGDLW